MSGSSAAEPAFGLYVHWPFCASKCPYCDFNSHVVGSIDQAAWRAAYLSEIARLGAELPGRRLESIFFGGGTPSLMPPATVAEILNAAADVWQVDAATEITLEANPTSVESHAFRDLAIAGVNRVSLGLQALDNTDLRRLGRRHSVAEGLSALETAQRHFGSVSFDLIYARQDQTVPAWRSELSQALSMGGDHLSLYQLTIEPQTAFGDRHARGRLPGLPDEDLGAELYEVTQEMTRAADLPAYEISNHACPGGESRHNLIYWRSQDYAGIGPGAHGRLTLGGERMATEAWHDPETWRGAVVNDRNGEAPRTTLSGQEMAEEHLLMGLRLRDGIDPVRHADLAGEPLPQGRIDDLEEMGLVTWHGDRLALTGSGRLVLNHVAAELLT